MYQLRPYQQQAVDATVEHFKESSEPAVIVLPTGAGKSLVIAELAHIARQKILVLAHVKELVEQNFNKYQSYGHSASIFSAGLNRKETSAKVVFGSVQSVARNLALFEQHFSLLIIDECHRVAMDDNSGYQQIIQHLKNSNPNLKILGLTATPYRLNEGWIYQQHKQNNCIRNTGQTFFRQCIFDLPLKYMIDKGFLTSPKLVDAPIAHYNFEHLKASANGHYKADELDHVIKKSQRATTQIIQQVIKTAQHRQGVMVFAATVAHAKEVMTLLPSESSAMIIGNMKEHARDSVINAFKAKKIKFLVNVSVLTTGFDAPHVDLIVMLRPTESTALYQQIIGRGLRLAPDKSDCLILDYAGNTHDLFQPHIEQPKPNSDAVLVEVNCPICQHNNQFWGKLDSNNQLLEHYGRRCQGLVNIEQSSNQKQQCDFRFRFKECPQCGTENDIAARQCHQCEQLLVDPDDKLRAALQLRDSLVLRCAGMSFSIHTSKKNRFSLKITYHDEDGSELEEYFGFDTPAQRLRFKQAFIHTHQQSRLQRPVVNNPQEAIEQQHLFRHPDFVIARKKQHFWEIRDKIFDYEGVYRRANELR